MEQELVYIVAVSGGVDSVVLLHKLVSKLYDKSGVEDSLKTHSPKYVVAHFDHGIRSDSTSDAEFVKDLADTYELEFVVGYGNLGPDASEATARDARYAFLRRVKATYAADKIITAHHQDDVLESIIINIIRGTGPRGLSPMTEQSDILRPLLHKSKQELLDYAKEQQLEWREDSTNTDEKYLRNYVRLHIMPQITSQRVDLLSIQKRIEAIYFESDARLQPLLPKRNVLSRSWFVLLPYSVQKEYIRCWLVRCGVEDLDSATIERITIGCKTLQAGKKIDISGKLWLVSEKQNILITSK